ncbi:MAG: LacI family DNA-binding transcriptional regulator [bacterium]
MTKSGANLNDLAQHLGLSKATVSRALNGYEDISEATKRRVLETALELGYEPSTSARRLAIRQTETIGLVLPAATGEASGSFISEFTASVANALTPQGFDLLVHSSQGESDPVSGYRKLVRARKVDGFIVIRTREQDARVDWLLEQGVPFVAHGRTARANEHAWIDIDAGQAFYQATQHLIALGHRRIAMISGGDLLYSSRLREQGFREAMKDSGLFVPEHYVTEGDLSGLEGVRRGAELLSAPERPTAVLCVNDATAFGMIKAVRDAGLRVPHDVSVIGYDGVALGELLDPPLTTMTRSIGESGQMVARLLFEVLRGASPRQHQTLWPAELLRRASDGPAP